MGQLRVWQLLVVVVLLYCHGSMAGECEAPSSQAISQFFGDINHWTEVESVDVNVIAQRNPIEFKVDFNNYWQSMVLKGGEPMSGFEGVCESPDPNVMIVHAKGHEIKLTRMGNMLKSDILFFTYYYRPDSQVDREASIESARAND